MLNEMKEGLRSSTLSKRRGVKTDFGKEKGADGGKNGFNMNSAPSGLFNDSSPSLLRRKIEKESEYARVECDQNADAGSGKSDDADCNAGRGEEGSSLISGRLGSVNDSVTNPGRDFGERGGHEQVAWSKDADVYFVGVNGLDHGVKGESQLPLVSNGLDPGFKEGIKSSLLIRNDLVTITGSAMSASEGNVEDHASGSKHGKDDGIDVCLNPRNSDQVVPIKGDEKDSSFIMGNSPLSNENADAYVDTDKSRHEHGNGFRGCNRENVECPRQEGTISTDVDMMKIGAPLTLYDLESAQDSIISSLKGNFERSVNGHVLCMENVDGELAINTKGEASANADEATPKLSKGRPGEKENVGHSRMKGDSAANKCIKEERISPSASIILDSAQDLAFSNTEIKVEETSGSQHMDCLKDADIGADEVTVADSDVKAIAESDEGMLRLEKRKRGRKRKKVKSSECNEDDGIGRKKVKEGKPQVTKRVLRSRTMAMTGSNRVIDSGTNGCVLGGKRKMKTECPDQIELHTEIDESNQQIQRPGKKLKRRGRPPKVKEEEFPSKLIHENEMKDTVVSSKFKRRGRPPKVQGELSASIVICKNELKDMVVSKIVKRRGRPPKALEENLASQVIHKKKLKVLVVSKKLERRGRPPKVPREDLASQMIHKNKVKDMVVSKKLKRLGRPPKVLGENLASQVVHRNKLKSLVPKTLKRLGRPPKVLGENLASHVSCKDEPMDVVYEDSSNRLKVEGFIDGSGDKVLKENGISDVLNDNKGKVKGSKKSSDQTEAEDAGKGHNAGNSIVKKKLKKKKPKGEVEMGRKNQKQLVRDQINIMIVNAGWKIEYRARRTKDYQDAVYIDPKANTHWSSTKAYRCLKQRIENGVANSREIAAFTIIPEEAFSTLFRHTNKERPRKRKKASKLGKCAGQTNKGTTGKETKKNKLGKKGKDRAKQKVKLKGDKSLCEKEVASSLKGRSKPRLLARSSEKGSNPDSDGFMPFSGKRSLLSWMIDLGTLLPGRKVHYGSSKRKKKRFEGTITRDGIHCGCCEEIISTSDFESHAGGKLGHTFNNIFLESGTSLLQCMLDSWRKEEESRHIGFNLVDVRGDDPNDDTCNICGDGGDLICCDGCPSTFHQSCLDIQNFPSGNWHCVYCSCKFCGMVAASTPPADDRHDTLVSELLSCYLCEEKFHPPCIHGEEAVNVDSGCPSFCGRKCQEIFERLQMYLGVRQELEKGFSWTLLQFSDVSQDISPGADPLKVECNSKLAVAFSIMDECFVPIIDERSGLNVIQNVVYNCGSNFRRLNYGGFCTAILERGDEIISAASIRIHGNQVAEMPFIGTRNMYRRQGMCRRLLNAIESALGSLDVEKLVIPAITELFQTWTSVFGFKPLEESKRRGMKCSSMIVFPGTDMLEKPLLNSQPADETIIPATGLNVDDWTTEHQTMSSAGSDSKAFFNLIDGDSDLHLPDGSLNDTSKPTHLSLGHGENPLAVSKDFSCDNGHSTPDDMNTSTKAQSDSVTIIVDDITAECNSKMNATNYEPRPIDVPGEGEQAIDSEQTREVRNLVNSEQLPFSRSHPDYRGPCALASVTNEICKSVEFQSDVDNDGIMEVKGSSMSCSVGAALELTSKDATEVSFDLNKDLAAAETDSDSVGGDSLPNGPQLCAKSYELSESGSQGDNPAGSLCNSDPCTTQSLVLV